MWTDGSGKSTRRFSFLLLQECEYYIQDWIATCRPSAPRVRPQSWQQSWFKGRLRLCCKSVFFEPDDITIPILMFPLNKVSRIEQLTESRTFPKLASIQQVSGHMGFIIETSMLVKMKKNGIDAPYEFDKTEGIWWFSLDYAPVQQFLQQAQSLLSINSLPPPERDMILRNTAAQKEAQAQFDISRLEDFNEEILFNYPAAQVTPLIREPGRLVLSENRLYFQPLHNLNNDTPVRCQKLSSIIAVARRRHSLQNIGLEIFFKDINMFTRTASGLVDGGSAFFTFQSSQERDDAVTKLLGKLQGQLGLLSAVGSLLDKDGSWLDRVTAAWQAGYISNYDYLMYLNLVAGRNRCDLGQWPVMPWVLKDYESRTLNFEDPETFRDLSKPIGALNPARLAIFHERFRQMSTGDNSDPPFLYGTHYSAPGYVLYWLVRAAPAHMLRLQNGRFDAPDRLFVSIPESWQSVLTNHADVKELIPEFYELPSDFLVTRIDLNLGVRQNGVQVGDVVLPPWARDPDDFCVKHRRALECKLVSMNIHKWIDLIFGYKQRGEAALSAENVFHQLTYEGAVDLEKIEDPFERMSLEAQINEFGQAPQQLFTGPHPSRDVLDWDHFDKQREIMKGNSGSLCAAILSRIMSRTVSFESGDSELMQVAEMSSPDSLEKTSWGVPEVTRAEDLAKEVATPVQDPPDSEAKDTMRTEVSYYDGLPWCSTPQTPQLEVTRFRATTSDSNKTSEFVPSSKIGASGQSYIFKRVDESQPWKVHREPVNAVLISDENASESVTLYAASKGGLIKVYSISEGFQIRATKLGNLPISSLALASSSDAYPTVLAGSYDNCVYAYSVDYGRSLGKVRVHDDTVSCVRVTGNATRMVTASWDATVKIWRLDEERGGWTSAFGGGASSSSTFGAAERELIEHDAAIWSLDVDEEGHLVASGAEDGTVILWDSRASGSPIWTSNELTGSAAAIRMSSDGKQVLVASTSGYFYALEVGQGGSILSQKNCGAPLRSCEIVDNLALAGSTNGELHFWSWNLLPDSSASDLLPLHDQTHAITSIAIGRRHGVVASVATASVDCSIQVYNVEQQSLC